MTKTFGKVLKGFTLIELLIVVAIIAILAAIAVPNFLEAQMRAKVSRLSADMRTVRVALEAYRVDNTRYPETDTGVEILTQPGVGLIRCTTPVSYMTSVPRSPFMEENLGNSGIPSNANKNIWYLYVRARSSPNVTDNNGYTNTYLQDRTRYLLGLGTPTPASLETAKGGYWELKSVGPNNVDDFDTIGPAARVYDPTNGTVSAGDIVQFGDTFGNAEQR